MDKSQILKLTTAIGETVLAIPIIGGILILSSVWSLLVIMLILHIISLVFASELNRGKAGNIVGIIGSLIGWIPVIGLFFHIATAITLWIEFSKENK